MVNRALSAPAHTGEDAGHARHWRFLQAAGEQCREPFRTDLRSPGGASPGIFRAVAEDPGGRTAWRTEIGSEWFPALLPGRLQEAPMPSVSGILTSMCGSR